MKHTAEANKPNPPFTDFSLSLPSQTTTTTTTTTMQQPQVHHHHQAHLSPLTLASPKAFFPPKTLLLFPTRSKTPKLRFGVSATARLATEPKSTMYDLLSVNETAGLDEIKAAYRKVARQWHPDTCRSDNKEYYTQQFIKAREAYRVLSDPLLREDYDYGLQSGFSVNGMLFRRGGSKKSSDFGDWESQLQGLNSKSRSPRRTSSWGSRMRAKSDQL